jgi:ABC-type branched-subunit amino acid transport system ATPase component
MPILSTKNLTKHFDGVAAVNHLSLDFEAGKVTGIIGPNGSGKSTLINLLTGVLPFDKGEIVVSEKVELGKIESFEAEEYGITRTFQDVRLFEQMPVLDNILVVLTERNVFSSLFEKHSAFHLAEAEKVLRKVGLWEKRNELAANLSYGQRKLLEVARVLAMLTGGGQEAEIILFDEPFAGMFPEMVKIVAGVIKELRDQGKAVILVEHNIELIRELCDHLFVLDAGKLLAAGAPGEVLAKPEVVEAYLGE